MNHYKLEPKNNIFKSLVVDITHRCNMRCANCYIPNRSIPDMDIDKLMDVLEELPFRTFIRLIGAEPTMREDLPDIIKKVIKLNHYPILFTNGLKLKDYDYVAILREAGLKRVYISMSGGDDDKVYKIIDNGRYSQQKVSALNNLFKLGFMCHVGCIIAKGINEHIPYRLVQLVIDTAKNNNKKLRRRYNAIRFRSIGAIGRYMKERHYPLKDLTRLISKNLGVNENEFFNNPAVLGTTDTISISSNTSNVWTTEDGERSYVTVLETSQGPLPIRITDWAVDNNGVIDPGSQNRGRITADWKIAPCFEDIKLNEYGY